MDWLAHIGGSTGPAPRPPAVAPAAGLTATAFETPGGNSVSSFILTPTPLTAENLQLAIDGGQVTKEQLCAGVDAATAPPACQ